MIMKISSRFPSVIFLKSNPKQILIRTRGKPRNVFFERMLVPSLTQSRFYVEKGKEPEKSGKEEEFSAKMPGFINPETMNEEGYFTQKARQQLEEMKRRGVQKPDLSNPEKKE